MAPDEYKRYELRTNEDGTKTWYKDGEVWLGKNGNPVPWYLKPVCTLPPDEFAAHQREGGKASLRHHKLKRRQSDILREILAMSIEDPERLEKLKSLGLEGNYAEAINHALVLLASSADVEAARYIRDTIGEKPRDGLEIGNLDDKPLETVDLSKLSDDQLRAMLSQRKAEAENADYE